MKSYLRLELLDVCLLVPAQLAITRRSYIELQQNRVIIIQVLLGFKLVYPVKSIVSPTLSDFKVGGELSSDLSRSILTYHLDTVLELVCFSRDALLHFQKYTDVVAVCVGAIAIWIHFETPGDAVVDQRL